MAVKYQGDDIDIKKAIAKVKTPQKPKPPVVKKPTVAGTSPTGKQFISADQVDYDPRNPLGIPKPSAWFGAPQTQLQAQNAIQNYMDKLGNVRSPMMPQANFVNPNQPKSVVMGQNNAPSLSKDIANMTPEQRKIFMDYYQYGQAQNYNEPSQALKTKSANYSVLKAAQPKPTAIGSFNLFGALYGDQPIQSPAKPYLESKIADYRESGIQPPVVKNLSYDVLQRQQAPNFVTGASQQTLQEQARRAEYGYSGTESKTPPVTSTSSFPQIEMVGASGELTSIPDISSLQPVTAMNTVTGEKVSFIQPPEGTKVGEQFVNGYVYPNGEQFVPFTPYTTMDAEGNTVEMTQDKIKELIMQGGESISFGSDGRGQTYTYYDPTTGIESVIGSDGVVRVRKKVPNIYTFAGYEENTAEGEGGKVLKEEYFYRGEDNMPVTVKKPIWLDSNGEQVEQTTEQQTTEQQALGTGSQYNPTNNPAYGGSSLQSQYADALYQNRYGGGGLQETKTLPWREEGYSYEEVFNPNAAPWRAGYDYASKDYYGNPYPQNYYKNVWAGGFYDMPVVSGYYLWNGKYYPIDQKVNKTWTSNYGSAGAAGGSGGTGTRSAYQSTQEWLFNLMNWRI